MRLVFRALILLCLCLPLRAWASPPNDSNLFFQETRREVDRALKRREGVVLWMDLASGSTRVFGDDRLLGQSFLPGSLMKLLTAELAVSSGKEYRYRCVGWDRFAGKRRHCWTRQGHGDMDLAKALGQSCNLYFSWLGMELGYGALRQALLDQGFVSATRLPETPTKATDAADLAIGDFPALTVTPEEMKSFWLKYLQRLSSPVYAPIRQGLRRAVQEGTAKRLGKLDLEILGKTGTGDALRSAYKTNGWFLGAFPVSQPRFAIVVFLQEAHGFEEAASLAERIFALAQRFGVLS